MRIPFSIQKTPQRPQKVYFELTNRCNFRCSFCPIQVSRRPKQSVDFDLLCNGIEETARERIASAVGFHVLGEPMLYPKLYDAVRFANSHGLRTELTTNGSLLTPERLEALTSAGLDSLTISLQTDESEHACRGAAGSFEDYYAGILEAVRLAARRGRPEIVLCAMDTSTRWLFDVGSSLGLSQGRQAYKQKLRRFVGDACSAAGVPRPHEDVARRLRFAEPKLIQISNSVSVYAQPFADWGNAFTEREVRPANFGACGYAMQNIGVLSNGEVTVCCADYDGHTSLGNLKSTPLKQLLASERAAAIRAGFDRWRPNHPHCRRCLGGATRLRAMLKGAVSIYLFGLKGFQPARVDSVRVAG